MKRTYKCLSNNEFILGEYKLVPIRDVDKYAIMKWRNEQIDILRQKEPLTEEKQNWYFNNVVGRLFAAEKPEQILFSFLKNDDLIGYGGLVYIDWESKNAEISFITATERNILQSQFSSDWNVFLNILKEVSSTELFFKKIYTYAYDLRPHLYDILRQNDFVEEARLKKHILVNGVFYDVLIHAFFFSN